MIGNVICAKLFLEKKLGFSLIFLVDRSRFKRSETVPPTDLGIEKGKNKKDRERG